MKKFSVVLILAVTLVLILIACAPSPAKTSTEATTSKTTTSATPTLTPVSGGVLKFVPRLPSQVFGYPGDMAVSAACDISAPCLESLCGVNIRGEFIPAELSTSFEIAPDGKSVTLTLRKGVRFHDGTDFNAQAAKWNLEQMKKARIPGTETWTSVIDVVDDSTVRINLRQYQNTFVGQLANISRIASPTAFGKYGVDKIHTYPVGTGPFKFVSFTPSVGVKYERNDDYWGGKPYLDGLEYIYISDEMAKSAAIQSKGVDILSSVTSETGISLRDKGYKVTVGGQDLLACLVPDSANAESPLSNIKVRQAIEYAIDRNALKELGNGFWKAAFQPSTPNTPGFVSDFKGRQYDPEKAKQLLAEAGYSNGFKLDFIFSTSNVTPMDTMVAVSQFLNPLGITSDLRQVPSPQRTDLSMNGWINGFITAGIYSSFNYLSGLQYFLTPGGNLFIDTTRPDGFGELLNQAASAMDKENVALFSQKINMMLYENSTIIPLWVAPQQLSVEQTYVHDTGLLSTGSEYEWTPEKAWLSK